MLARGLAQTKRIALAEDRRGSRPCVTSSRGGSGAFGAGQGLVPLEALQALEQSRDAAERERSSISAQLVTQRLRHISMRLMFVDYFDHATKSELSAEEAREARKQMMALNETKRDALRSVFGRFTQKWEDAFMHSALMAWQIGAHKQVRARQSWHYLVEKVVSVEEEQSFRERPTIAQRLAMMNARRGEVYYMGGADDAQLAAVALTAWRSWTRMKVLNRQSEAISASTPLWVAKSGAISASTPLWVAKSEAISASIPLWVAKIGDRRRVERAWLGWRLWLAERQVHLAEEKLMEGGLPAVRKAMSRSSTSGWGSPPRHSHPSILIPTVSSEGGTVAGGWQGQSPSLPLGPPVTPAFGFPDYHTWQHQLQPQSQDPYNHWARPSAGGTNAPPRLAFGQYGPVPPGLSPPISPTRQSIQMGFGQPGPPQRIGSEGGAEAAPLQDPYGLAWRRSSSPQRLSSSHQQSRGMPGGPAPSSHQQSRGMPGGPAPPSLTRDPQIREGVIIPGPALRNVHVELSSSFVPQGAVQELGPGNYYSGGGERPGVGAGGQHGWNT
eukprot:gene32703-5340_t